MSVRQPEQLYETDFYAWTQAQARELRRFARTRPNAPLDLAHIAEEIRDLGKSDRDAILSLSQQILQHFLLIEHSAALEQRTHWMDEIDEFRTRMKRKLSPTIRRHLKRHGEVQAVASLPAECPYSVEQVLGDWLPNEGPLSPA
jgi:hypothetical protein